MTEGARKVAKPTIEYTNNTKLSTTFEGDKKRLTRVLRSSINHSCLTK
jgi:hypothetical protein